MESPHPSGSPRRFGTGCSALTSRVRRRSISVDVLTLQADGLPCNA
jgi:hypothetical protein